MKFKISIYTCFILSLFSVAALATDRIELDTAIIKANKESPAILYIVPWKPMRIYNDEYQGLIIDDLQGDLLVPSLPGRKLLTR